MEYVPQLLLALVSHRVVSGVTVHSIDSLRLAAIEGNFPIPINLGIFSGDALIGRSRSIACTTFLDKTEIPYMLFIDDDIGFTYRDVLKIYNHLVKGYDVVGGLYPVKGAGQVSSYGWDGVLSFDGTVKDIEYLATGFMGISRKILLKIKDELKLPLLNPEDWSRCYPFFECGRCYPKDELWKHMKHVLGKQLTQKVFDDLTTLFGAPTRKKGHRLYISEDWDFCEKARKVGANIYADTTVQLGHMRESLYTCKDVVDIQGREVREKETYGAFNKHHELMLSADTDLGEFLSRPVKEVQKVLGIKSQEKIAKDFKAWQGTAEDFYRDREDFLYDIVASNRFPLYYQSRFGPLVNFKNQKILDFGCGVGTLVFILSDQDNEVTGYDINKRCLEFCEYKKKKYDLKGTFTDELPDLSQFDLICFVDVWEHIEDLKGLIDKLGKEMKSGAKIYHADYFPQNAETGELLWPMHFTDNEQHVQKWLKEAGFAHWDGVWAIKS